MVLIAILINVSGWLAKPGMDPMEVKQRCDQPSGTYAGLCPACGKHLLYGPGKIPGVFRCTGCGDFLPFENGLITVGNLY